jgi:uncharacterized MAPEG superfamily protein
MHLAYWMILIAALLPYATVGGAKAATDYDNANPRAYLARQQGWRARADAAHRNHFEAFPAFAAAVIVAQVKSIPEHVIDVLAVTFVVIRVAYTVAYLANAATLRSLIWITGFACTVALFVI